MPLKERPDLAHTLDERWVQATLATHPVPNPSTESLKMPNFQFFGDEKWYLRAIQDLLYPTSQPPGSLSPPNPKTQSWQSYAQVLGNPVRLGIVVIFLFLLPQIDASENCANFVVLGLSPKIQAILALKMALGEPPSPLSLWIFSRMILGRPF